MDCAEAIKRLTTDRSSNRIAYTIMLVFTIIMAVVCGTQFLSGITESGILTAAGLAGTGLCLRELRKLQPAKAKPLSPFRRILLPALGILCALLCAFFLLAFLGSAPDYDFSMLWLSLWALMGCIATLVRWKKK